MGLAMQSVGTKPVHATGLADALRLSDLQHWPPPEIRGRLGGGQTSKISSNRCAWVKDTPIAATPPATMEQPLTQD